MPKKKVKAIGMSNCDNVPLFLEVMAPALSSGSTLQDILFNTASNWASEYKNVIEKFVCDFCSGISFYIENVDGKDHVIARTAIKRDKTDVIISIIKEALSMIGVDMNKLRIKIYDPCKCQG
jgi:hypothetical protein